MHGSAPPDRYGLYYGSSEHPIAEVISDATWPSMWRVAWPDGRLSDMVNLTRAKDAAVVIAERGPPARNHLRLRWKRIGPVGEAVGSSVVGHARNSTHAVIWGQFELR